jgi:hypothetical protein
LLKDFGIAGVFLIPTFINARCFAFGEEAAPLLDLVNI